MAVSKKAMESADTVLICRFVDSRDDAAFAELVRRHIDLVYCAALRRVGDVHLAEDIAQAVFTTLAAKASSLRRHHSLVGWLHTTTRFAASEVLRAERRRRAREQEAFTMQEPPADPGDEAAWEKMRPVIDDALGELSERDREAVLLRYFSHLSFAAVGAALGLPENTARMRVGRALDKLHGLLTRRGLTSTSAALATVLTSQATAASTPVALASAVTSTALATVGAGVGATGATTLLMGLTKVHVTFATAALLVLGAAFYERLSARHLEAQAQAAQAEVASLTQAHARLAADLRAAQATRTAAQQKIPAGAATTPAGTAAAASADSQLEIVRDNYLHRRMVARTDPEYQRLQSRQRLFWAGQNHAPLLRQLNLSAERTRQFESIVAEHEQAVDDIEAAGDTQRVAMWNPVIDRLRTAEVERYEGQMRDLLGAEGYARYEQYRVSLPLRTSITNSITSSLYATSTPLNADQAEALTQVLDRHARPGKNGIKDRDGLDWDAALQEATPLLAPAQLAALQALRAQTRWNATLSTALGPMVGMTPPPAQTEPKH